MHLMLNLDRIFHYKMNLIANTELYSILAASSLGIHAQHMIYFV